MPALPRVALPFALLTVAWTLPCKATPWLDLHAPAECGPESTASRVEQRVLEAVVGTRSPVLQATVRLASEGEGFSASIRVSRAAEVLGHKRIEAATCEEAVDATVAVLGLALSSSQSETEPKTETDSVVGEESARVPLKYSSESTPRAPTWRAAGGSPLVDRGTPQAGQSESGSILELATGVDSATLGTPGAFVALGYGYHQEHLEFRGVARYGLPQISDEVSGDPAEGQQSERQEFGALELDGCYRLGASWSLSACAGAEVAMVVSSRSSRTELRTASSDVPHGQLAGVLGTVLAYRDAAIHPTLEVSGLAITGGGASPRVGARVSAGAALRF